MNILRACTLSTIVLLASNAVGFSQTQNPTATDQSADPARTERLNDRLDGLESRLDRLIDSLENKAPATPDPKATANLASADPTVPAPPTSQNDLKPGWVVRTYPLDDNDLLAKSQDALSAFVIDKSEFDLSAHVPHSLFAANTRVAYEMKGFLNIEEEGRHALGVLIAKANRNDRCGVKVDIEGQTVFEDKKLAGSFDPVMAGAELEPGLYETTIWLGCRFGQTAPSVQLLLDTPSTSAPQKLDPERVGHKEL